MTKKGCWIELPEIQESAYKEGFQQNINGVDITVFVSPYDVPEAIRGSHDDERNVFTIELRYIGEEPLDSKMDSPVTFFFGKRSRRLYKIEVATDNINAIRLALAKIVEHPPKGTQERQRRRNYELAIRAIEAHPDLLAGVR